ncbi:MAG TPA: LacI family DNA-binding transcriptional regulator [Spirochaetia bacterium]|nr:LacI family DNA-binding transcriptional regulator [Spirochaetia bacterium]
MPNTRLKDVARKARVSVATVSLVLADKGRISQEVRGRVRETAASLGYRPRSGSRGGRPAAAATVGILCAEDRQYEWNFIRPTILELEHALRQRGHTPVLIPAASRDDPDRTVQHVQESGVRAVFSLQISAAAVFAGLRERGIHVVVINTSGFQDRLDSVCVDDFQGAYEGARYLLGLGHRSVAFVEYARPESPAVVADRFIGFRKALDEQRVGFSPERRITVPFMDTARLEKRLAALFSRPGRSAGGGRPTAIFAHDDYLGLYVIEALGRMGLSVPGDVSLVAPGDVLDYSLPLMPQITTLRIDTALLGKIAANLMFDRMRAAEPGPHVLKVKEQLVRRSSCRELEIAPRRRTE